MMHTLAVLGAVLLIIVVRVYCKEWYWYSHPVSLNNVKDGHYLILWSTNDPPNVVEMSGVRGLCYRVKLNKPPLRRGWCIVERGDILIYLSGLVPTI